MADLGIYIRVGKSDATLVDREDYDLVSQRTYHIEKNKAGNRYVLTNRRKGLPKVPLHRMLFGLNDERVVDHIDNDGTNNRRNNLRVCTQGENVKNQRPSQSRKYGPTHLKGFAFHKPTGKWAAHISLNNHHTYLGLYNSPEDAAHAYDAAAKQHYGKFARLNFPDEV